MLPFGDKEVDGDELDASGVFQGQGAPPDYVVSFPKAGTYRYVCSIHPGMQGTVKVLPKKSKASSKAKDAKAVAKQVAATVKSAKKLAAQPPTGNVVRAGNDRREVAFFSFFPVTTGLLDTDPRTSFPASKSVTFTKAGTYSFICTVHGPTMKGSIEVS